MARVLAFSLALLTMPAAAHAQAQYAAAFRASLVAAVAAHGADLASTEFCLGARTCTEANPWLTRFSTQPGVFGAAKMGVAALSLWGTAKLHESHPRLAILANVAQTVAFSAIAIRNARAMAPPR